jgi:chorismate mutase/prephenate dehydratase
MSKGKPTEKENKGGPRATTIPALRAKIDRIDRDLVALMNERAGLAHEIGKLKDANGQQCYDPAREEEVLARVAELSQGPLSAAAVRSIFRELISGSRALERALRVSYLGPAYTYSHLAALDRFGQSVELVPVGTIPAVFEEVSRGQAQFGVVPLENSTDGRVADTLDMFTRHSVQICGEAQLRIHHYLLARCARADVQEVYSRPQALSQCRNWLARHLPQARTIEVTSTATAAQLAQDKPGAAAIASIQAGIHYRLDVLAENIEDVQGNLTRFAVIGQHAAARSGHDKTAIMFELLHKPGALADAINVFKRLRLNLTWIESFPIAGHDREYLFFAEFEGHHTDARVKRALVALNRKTVRMVLLGSYAKSAVVE